MKNIERFTDRVKNYVRYRPHYPIEIIPFLKHQIKLDSRWIVADIGSGTGISSELFLQNGNLVYAVEPNSEMRKAAEGLFQNNSRFFSINATAENTSLSDCSVDLLLAGQAFHWFDPAAAKTEFKRIAKPGAYLVLMWNERKSVSPFQQQYEKMLLEYAAAYEKVCQHNIDETTIREFYLPHSFQQHIFPLAQSFDFEGLKGRLLSSSYAPQEQQPNFPSLMQRLAQIFDAFSVDGKVDFEYHCKVYYGLF